MNNRWSTHIGAPLFPSYTSKVVTTSSVFAKEQEWTYSNRNGQHGVGAAMAEAFVKWAGGQNQ